MSNETIQTEKMKTEKTTNRVSHDGLAIAKSSGAFTLWAAQAQMVSSGYTWRDLTAARSYGVETFPEWAWVSWAGAGRIPADPAAAEAEAVS